MLETIKKDLLDDVIKIAHEAATRTYETIKGGVTSKHQYVHEDILKHLDTKVEKGEKDTIGMLAMKRSQYATETGQMRSYLVTSGFGDITTEVGKQSDSEINHLSRLVALDTLATNAVNSAERAATYTEPQELIAVSLSKSLSRYFKKEPDKVGGLDRLKKTINSLLVSLVDTKHPTIYHTPEASAFEARLSQILEDKTNHMPKNPTDSLRLNEKGKKEVAALFASEPNGEDLAAGFMTKLASGKGSISPKRQLTVGIETKAQVGYRKEMQKQLGVVVKAWNDAIKDVKIDGLTSEQLAETLMISPEREKKMIEFRTWGEAFDADGRDKSTSRFLSECIQKNLIDVKDRNDQQINDALEWLKGGPGKLGNQTQATPEQIEAAKHLTHADIEQARINYGEHRAAGKNEPEFLQKELTRLGMERAALGGDGDTGTDLNDQKVHNNKLYSGAIGDMRQNAREVHLPFISALIQVKVRNSADESRGRLARYTTPDQIQAENGGVSFIQFCRDFMNEVVDAPKRNSDGEVMKDANDNVITEPKTREKKYEDLNGHSDLPWHGPEYSIFQQLDAEDKAKFLTEIIEKNYKFLPEQMRADTLAFNLGECQTARPKKSVEVDTSELKGININQLGDVFLERYAEQIIKAGLDPKTITYDQMIKVSIPHDPSKPDGVQVSLRGAFDTMIKLNGWEMVHSGLTYTPLPGGPPEKPVLDFWNYVHPEQILVQNFLMSTKKDGKHDLQDLDERDRSIATDTAKRLFIINDAIDKYGSKVATRYQIANFSEASDFLTLLKLFQDTGIAKIKNGRVTSSKLAIQPLLETGEDLKNAPAIFGALLGDPKDAQPTLAKSFWKARNNEAEIMLGFSDGAASVGNFASQWEIYKATQELTKLFGEHGIKVRFFQGRGRGTDRGGSIDPSLQMDLMSPEAMQRGIYDVTLQADLPMDLAASPAYGKDYFTKILLGTLDATLTAPDRIKLAETEPVQQMEKDIQRIADRSAAIYQELVRTNNPEMALKVLNKQPDNKFKTSRAAARGTEKESTKFDKVRAIPKEYKFNGMDLQVHNVGLKQALEEFEKEPDGKQRLAALTQHPFFKAITQTIRAGMSNYDPAIARAHAEAIKLKPYNLPDEAENVKPKNFVERVIPHLEGLADKLDIIATGKKHDNFPKPSWSSVLDQIAHSIIVDGLNKGKPNAPMVSRPDQKEWADTLFNSLFVTAQEVGHRDLPWRGQNTEQGVAA